LSNIRSVFLFCAETAGRKEVLLELFNSISIQPKSYNNWPAFLTDDAPLGICVGAIDQGLLLSEPAIAIIAESQLFGQQVLQRRQRKKRQVDPETLIHDLVELSVGAPVVHIDHGVGRYQGLQTLTVEGHAEEFLTLEYAGGDKLYVPVASLHLISRYSGNDVEHAPLHALGSGKWEKSKRKAAERVHDVATELLALYATREARQGFKCKAPDEHYYQFVAEFPFEETQDQLIAIEQVIKDLTAKKPMDRLVCGDVGFGKTEVAMRAAFMLVQSGKQVAILVPTTLLAQQHYQNFQDRFANWPIKIEMLSRFRSAKEQNVILESLAQGKVDIIIGTHKLLQTDIQFKQLGLLIIDEEHRFGVKQKERLKALRAEVDILTLTATPIPRTLNMAMSGIRELSIIATPPPNAYRSKLLYKSASIISFAMRFLEK
jgi:transcription-repair coupling factor (superfamily II helicase)